MMQSSEKGRWQGGRERGKKKNLMCQGKEKRRKKKGCQEKRDKGVQTTENEDEDEEEEGGEGCRI